MKSKFSRIYTNFSNFNDFKIFFVYFFTGFWVRSSVTSAIYRKSLRVSPQGKAESTTGEVVNLMSVDTQRIVDMMPYINMLWRFVKPNYFNKQRFSSLFFLTWRKCADPEWPWSTREASLCLKCMEIACAEYSMAILDLHILWIWFYISTCFGGL